eukprot:2474324-Pyramimonas_sp.AAC.1
MGGRNGGSVAILAQAGSNPPGAAVGCASMVAAGASAALGEYLALRGKAGARASADNLIQKLTAELIAVRVELQRARELQAALINALGADSEVSRREALARPVLAAEVAGLTVEGTQKLIRNEALHAKQCPSADAPLS